MAHPSQNIRVDSVFKKEHPRRSLSLKFLYFKSVFGLVLGIVLGFFKVTGVLGFMCFLPLQYLLAHVYCTFFNVPDYMMDRMEMFTEQAFPSLALFVVMWTVSYTLFQ